MRKTIGALVLLAAAVGVVYLLVRPARAENPFTGRWAVSLIQGANQGTLWLIEVEEKDGKASGARVLFGAGAALRETTLKDFQADDKTMSFTLEGGPGAFAVVVQAPGGEGRAPALRGTVRIRGAVYPLLLEETDASEVPADEDGQPLDGADDLEEAAGKKGGAAVQAVRAFLDENADKPIALQASDVLLQLLLREKAGDEELRAAAGRVVREAGTFGPELQRGALLVLAGRLLDHDKDALAVGYARKAEELLTEDTPPEEQLGVLEALAAGLKRTGKEDEAKELALRIDRLNEALDEQFTRDNIPFKPRKFGGRAGEGRHVATVELFTGAQCPPCVAADVAFDAALQTYTPREVVLLQYHLHVPGPDPLTSPASLERAKYYEVRGTPAVFLDGGEGPKGVGGLRPHSQTVYSNLRKALDRAVEAEDRAAVSVRATREGDEIAITAEVSELKDPGQRVRLRLLLVEDVVRYQGNNGQRLHHHVVRAMPGGAEGVALKEKAVKHRVTVSLAEVRKGLEEYLRSYEVQDRFGNRVKLFAGEDDLRLTLKDLKVVALVQDDRTHKILQAAQADVPEAE